MLFTQLCPKITISVINSRCRRQFVNSDGKNIAFSVIIVNNYYSDIYYDILLGEQYPTYVQEHLLVYH